MLWDLKNGPDLGEESDSLSNLAGEASPSKNMDLEDLNKGGGRISNLGSGVQARPMYADIVSNSNPVVTGGLQHIGNNHKYIRKCVGCIGPRDKVTCSDLSSNNSSDNSVLGVQGSPDNSKVINKSVPK